MKRKALCFILTLLVIAVFSLGCGGGGGHSNPAASNLSGNAKVSGIVVDSSNKPVANAQVKLALSSDSPVKSLIAKTKSSNRLSTTGNQTEFETTTNNKGEYTFTNVPYGEYTLSALTADKAQIVLRLVVQSDQVDTPEIVLVPFGTVKGTVTGGADGATIVYIEGTSYCSATDNTGNYSISCVPVSNTPYTLNVYSSGYELKEKVSLTASIEKASVDSNKNLSWTQNLTLSAVSASSIYTLNCTIKGDGASSENLMVFAVNKDTGFTFASRVENSKCNLLISRTGSYDVFAASVGYGFNLAGSIVNVDVKNFGSSKSVDLQIDSLSAPMTSEFAVFKGKIDNTYSGDDSFGVSLFAKNGKEYRKSVSANTPFEFNTLPVGTYSVVVFSEHSLQIFGSVEMSLEKETDFTDAIKPIKITPAITTDNGIATLTITYTGITTPTNKLVGGNNELFFSVYASNSESESIPLYNKDSEGTINSSFDAYSESNTLSASLSVDNLSETDSIDSVVFSFNNGQEQPIFEQSFAVSSSQTPKYKKVTLSNLSQSDDVILFKTIEYRSNIYYLIVTSSKAFVYGSDGTAIQTVSFAEKFSSFGFDSNSSIRYGNACYAVIDENPTLAVQFVGRSSLGDPAYYIIKYELFNTEAGLGGIVCSESAELDSSNGRTNASLNKLLIQDGKFYSSRELEIYEKQDGDDSSVVKKKIIPTENGFIIASYTSFLFPDFEYVCYLEQGCSIDKVYLNLAKYSSGVSGSEDGYSVCESIAIGDNTLSSSNLYTYNSKYSYLIDNTFPYSITDCLDNTESENKIFVWENYAANWNNGSPKDPNINPKYVYSDAIYSGTIIKSGYTSLGYNFDAWIDRTSGGQFLKIREKNTYREQKISIKQVLNSSSFLEDSIGYSSKNGQQIHVICSGDSGSIQVLVLDCF
jgi:hypothetical protein